MSPSSSDTFSSRAPRGASHPPSAVPIANSQPSDRDNAKKSAWGTITATCSSSSSSSSSNGVIEVGPVMGAADSWPALGESTAKTVPKSSSPPSDSTKISSKSSSSGNNGGAILSPMPSASGGTILPEKKESLSSPRNNNSNWDHGSSSRGGISNGFFPQTHGGPDHHHRPFNRRGNNNGGHRGNGWHNNPHPRHVAPPPRSFSGLQPPVPPLGPASFVGVRPFVGPPMGFPAEIPSHVYYVPPAPFVAPYVAVHPMAHAMPPLMVDNSAELRAAVSKQIEYYFSNDNLVKDTYLRKQMDGQGWVPVSLIAGFRQSCSPSMRSLVGPPWKQDIQVKNITINIPNNINFILDSIRNVELVEVQGEKIRRRGDWMKWLMKAQPNQNCCPLVPRSQALPNTDNIVDRIQGVVLEEGTSDRSTSGNIINQSGWRLE